MLTKRRSASPDFRQVYICLQMKVVPRKVTLKRDFFIDLSDRAILGLPGGRGGGEGEGDED